MENNGCLKGRTCHSVPSSFAGESRRHDTDNNVTFELLLLQKIISNEKMNEQHTGKIRFTCGSVLMNCRPRQSF